MFFYSESDEAGGGAATLPTSWSELTRLTQGAKFLNTSPESSTIAIRSDSSYEASVYEKQNNNWVKSYFINDPDSYYGDSTSLSGDGNVWVVGFPRIGTPTHSGKVRIYEKINGTWQFSTELSPPSANMFDYFGFSVSISLDGTSLFVGKVTNSGTAGRCYVYQKINNSWVLEAELQPDNNENQRFGYSVKASEDGQTVFIRARTDSPDGVNYAGSIYVFKKQNGNWNQLAKLTASDKMDSDLLGDGLTIPSNASLVCASSYAHDTDGIADTGAAYIFQYNGSTWQEIQKLVASDKQAGDRFGVAASFSSDGTLLAIGAHNVDIDGISSAGAVYLFKNNNGLWEEMQKLTPATPTQNQNFGRTLSFSPDANTLFVGTRVETIIFQGT
jgi:hypothetical protein